MQSMATGVMEVEAEVSMAVLLQVIQPVLIPMVAVLEDPVILETPF